MEQFKKGDWVRCVETPHHKRSGKITVESNYQVLKFENNPEMRVKYLRVINDFGKEEEFYSDRFVPSSERDELHLINKQIIDEIHGPF